MDLVLLIAWMSTLGLISSLFVIWWLHNEHAKDVDRYENKISKLRRHKHKLDHFIRDTGMYPSFLEWKPSIELTRLDRKTNEYVETGPPWMEPITSINLPDRSKEILT